MGLTGAPRTSGISVQVRMSLALGSLSIARSGTWTGATGTAGKNNSDTRGNNNKYSRYNNNNRNNNDSS